MKQSCTKWIFALAACVIAVAPAQLVKAQEVNVVVNTGFAPYHINGPGGTIIGYNIDLLEEISKRIERPYKLVDVEFSSLIAGINSGAYDFSAAATQITPERGKSVLFAEPFIEVDFGVLVLKDNLDKVKTIEDLRGKTIAVNRGSLHDHWFTAREAEFGWTVKRYSKMSDAVQAVASGRDFSHAAGEGALRYVSQQNARVGVALAIPSGGEYAFMFGLNQVELRNSVERALECMKLDGTVARIHEKWMGVKPKAGGLAYTPQPGFGAKGTTGYDPTPHEFKCS